MPITIRCKKCGNIIYHSSKLFSVKKFLAAMGKCPFCGSQLTKELDKLEIRIS